MNPLEFGHAVGTLLEKNAGGLAAMGKSMGGMLGGAAKAAPPAPIGRAGAAAPAWLRNNQAVAKGLDPTTGLKPGAVAPAPPPVPTAPKVTISPAEAAAGRAKVTVTPQEAAAAQPFMGFGPKPDYIPKVTISPAEAAAGRAKTVISPQQAAAAKPLPQSPGLRTPSRNPWDYVQ